MAYARPSALEEELHRLEIRYQGLTGQEGYLYAYAPGDQHGKRYVFASGPTAFGARRAVERMRAMVVYAEQHHSVPEPADTRLPT